jgi:proline iminopeptidase
MANIHVVEHGSGNTAMVIFHGGMGLDHSHLRYLDPLGNAVRLIYFDATGHGRSAEPADWNSITHESWVDDAEAVRAQRGIERWLVFGHSYGAFLALTYALRHRQRVTGIILSNVAPSFDHRDRIIANVMKRATPEIATLFGRALSLGPESDDEMGKGWRALLPLYFHRWNPLYLDAFASTRYSAAGYRRGNVLLGGYDVSARLVELPPALVISGDDDFMFPVHLGAQIAMAVVRGQHAVLAATGHFPFIENPASFFQCVRDFIVRSQE